MGKYDNINPLEKLHPGEPFFLIRGQDVFAPAAIQAYATLSNQQGDLHPFIDRVLKWQAENPEKVKIPD